MRVSSSFGYARADAVAVASSFEYARADAFVVASAIGYTIEDAISKKSLSRNSKIPFDSNITTYATDYCREGGDICYLTVALTQPFFIQFTIPFLGGFSVFRDRMWIVLASKVYQINLILDKKKVVGLSYHLLECIDFQYFLLTKQFNILPR